jgi:hypothetical protein
LVIVAKNFRERGKLIEEVSVLIASCDAYSDLWEPFFSLFWTHWHHCPFDVYLGSNFLEIKDTRVKIISVGEDESWSTNLLKMLNSIRTPYIILLLEDFFLRNPIDNQKIFQCFEALKTLKGIVVRLVPNPKPDAPVEGFPFLGSIGIKAPYRVSTQASLWRRNSLISLVQEGESAWEFELNCTRRSQDLIYGF